MITHPGSPVPYSMRQHYANCVPKKHVDEQVVVHHVTEDTPYRLQLEVERRIRGTDGKVCRCEFERVVLT